MFKELLPLLEGRTMILTAAKIGDALTVTIYPKRNGEKDENPVGNTPLCVTGTAEELDHELPGLIAGYVEELGKFHSNLDQIKQQLANAATAAAEAAKVKTGRKPATAPAKAAAKSAEPAEPPVARPDLFTTSMPPAAAVPESQPAQADAADGTAAIRTDPAGSWAFDPQTHAFFVGRAAVRTVGRKPIFSAILRRRGFPARGTVRPVVADTLASAARGGAALGGG